MATKPWTAKAPVRGTDGTELAIWEAALAAGDDTEILPLPLAEERAVSVDSSGASVTVTGYTDHPDDLATGGYTPKGEAAWDDGAVTANTQAAIWGPITGIKAAASGGAATARVSARYRRNR